MAKVFLPVIKNKYVVEDNGGVTGSNSDEDTLFEMIKNSEYQQRRKEKIFRHPLLDLAARKRAEDMVEKNYFSHTSPDGTTPHEVIRSVGYFLPKNYMTKGNYVESINSGSGRPIKTYNSWLGSPHHRSHVFGEVDFFREQGCFGIGSARNKEGRVISVCLTAPCI